MKPVFMSDYINIDSRGICEVGRVDFTNPRLKGVLASVGDDYNDALLKAIRKVGNTDITAICMSKLEYTVAGKVISLSELCTAEFYFFLAEISKLLGNKFAIIDGARMLSNKILKMFIEDYQDCDIYLVCLDNEQLSFYRVLEIGEGLGVW